jgi:hypothetical protein
LLIETDKGLTQMSTELTDKNGSKTKAESYERAILSGTAFYLSLSVKSVLICVKHLVLSACIASSVVDFVWGGVVCRRLRLTDDA